MQARLAEARLARQEERMAAALGRLGDQAIGEFEQVVAPDEERALDGTRDGHDRGV